MATSSSGHTARAQAPSLPLKPPFRPAVLGPVREDRRQAPPYPSQLFTLQSRPDTPLTTPALQSQGSRSSLLRNNRVQPLERIQEKESSF
eukprot:m.52027 g.52027  ORF g.52027 m.52027 type:complete len:90 (-) comp13476_c0_seq2:1410-1679(-)